MIGPLGFAVIVNDAAVDTPFVTLKYVDDLTLVESKPSSQKSVMQQYLNDFQQWAFVNNMKLNPNKCASMKVSFLVNDHDDPPLTISQVAKIVGVHECRFEMERPCHRNTLKTLG